MPLPQQQQNNKRYVSYSKRYDSYSASIIIRSNTLSLSQAILGISFRLLFTLVLFPLHHNVATIVFPLYTRYIYTWALSYSVAVHITIAFALPHIHLSYLKSHKICYYGIIFLYTRTLTLTLHSD